MPTTVRPQPGVLGVNNTKAVSTAQELLRQVSYSDKYKRLLLTSFTNEERIVPYPNGFVYTVLRAWQQDLHLELRPDDVWLAILAQFSFFVNGHAEVLRRVFVAHEGKRSLVVDVRPRSLDTVDMGAVAQELAALVRAQLATPDLADWLLPEFSTTLPIDRSTAAAMFLGTMGQYFDVGVVFGCGFPSVTLHGERGDWAELAQRAARFAQFGDEPAAWSRCLVVAIEGILASFDRPDHADVRDFWMRACHSAGSNASGELVTLSGWLTAFCWWKADGRRQKAYEDHELAGMWHLGGPDGWQRLELSGLAFPIINMDEIPVGVTRVPINFHDEDRGFEVVSTTLVAGSTGMKLIDAVGSRVQPSSGWWLLMGE
ncbi:Uncharacterized protein TPAR_07100 [Tolypocladium paradoxum]|uniref:DUF4419 domain-containing protein n=1 Tax=Tolypocladium paradoxum TaxID=94208 RepID=A0A2S4KRA2_9HYPO|nr:Uncharacterized protein TPAR_07100 [Tolypocladium paradoxum]